MTPQHRHALTTAPRRHESHGGAIRRCLAIVAGVVLAALSLAWAPAALAMRPDPDDGTGGLPPSPDHAGSGAWMVVLVVAVAVCLTVAATVAVQHIRRGRAASAAQIAHA